MFYFARGLRDVDISKLFLTIVGDSLFHLHASHARLVEGRRIPSHIGKTKRKFGEVIGNARFINYRNRVEGIILGEPQVPRPYNRSAFRDSNDGVTVLNLVLRHMELYKLFVGRKRKTARFYNAALVCPNNLCSIGHIRASIALRNPRISDILTCMILEVFQDIRA